MTPFFRQGIWDSTEGYETCPKLQRWAQDPRPAPLPVLSCLPVSLMCWSQWACLFQRARGMWLKFTKDTEKYMWKNYSYLAHPQGLWVLYNLVRHMYKELKRRLAWMKFSGKDERLGINASIWRSGFSLWESAPLGLILRSLQCSFTSPFCTLFCFLMPSTLSLAPQHIISDRSRQI